MGTTPRRILTESERLGAERAEAGDPILDLIVYYLDRIFRHVEFRQEFFLAALVTLTDESRLALAATLFAGRPPSELAQLTAEDGFPDPALLGRAVVEAWSQWERRDRLAGAEDKRLLDTELVERETLKAFRACHSGRDLRDPCPVQRERLSSIFGLTDPEVEILVFLWCSANEPLFRGLVDDLSLGVYHRALADCAGVDPKELKSLLAPRGRLVDMGFVIPDYFPPPHYALGDEIRQFFNDPETIFSFVLPLERHLRESSAREVPLESFSVPAVSLGILEAILRGGKASVLVHGAPGTGKTTFATSLVRKLGLPAFILSAVGGGEDGRSPLLRLKVASHLARNAGAVLVVDEADGLLNTQGRGPEAAASAKAWLTEFMDCHAGAVVWIANEVGEVHDAVKRRFAYSLEFNPQDERQRALLWGELVRDYGFEGRVGGEAIAELSRSYEVSAGGIDIALRGLKSVLSSEAAGAPPSKLPGEPVAVLSEILRRHEVLMSGGRAASRPKAVREDGLYLPEAINVDTRLDELVAGLKEVARGLKARRELEAAGGAWAAGGQPGEAALVLEAKLLFSGGPGTGKTAFARWLAAALGLPLAQKRASDLLSALVGGTEQLIASAFEEAEREGAILLLDEADSLFLDRRYAERSWERSQTNELLTRMEAFSGILVCCTNRREDFDPAAMRRFQWKLAFSPPRPEQRLELYRRYFSALCGEPGEEARAELRRLEGLCPGDFAAAHKALVPLAAARRAAAAGQPACLSPGGDREASAGRPGGAAPAGDEPGSARIGHGEVLSRLRSELACRGVAERRRIGFES